jgi:hypothetical protein
VRLAVIVSIAVLCAGMGARAAAPQDAKLAAAFLDSPSMSSLPPLLEAWDEALRKALKAHRPAPRGEAGARLAPLWLRFSDLYWNERRDTRLQSDLRRALDRDFLALAADSKADPLVLEAATAGQTSIGFVREGRGWRFVQLESWIT